MIEPWGLMMASGKSSEFRCVVRRDFVIQTRNIQSGWPVITYHGVYCAASIIHEANLGALRSLI